jgi:HPt (histidine-containing phosphotransfer) domain-containing protein
MDGLWARFLPEIKARVAVLEAATQTASEGKLTAEQREASQAAAHKLAGVLGTFGLTKGTVLAREAEILYSGGPDADPEDAARLTLIAAQLRTIVASRK